jgi:hypothetical protein
LFKAPSGAVISVTDPERVRRADAEPTFRRLTQDEYSEYYRKQAEEDRKTEEARAAAEYSKARPFRSALGTALMEFSKVSLPLASQALMEKFGDLTMEEQQQLAEQFPKPAKVGTGLGAVGALASALATSGASLEAQAAGRAAAVATAATGAGRLGQAGAAFRAATTTAPTVAEAAFPAVGAISRVATGTQAALRAAAPGVAETALGRAGIDAAAAAAASGAMALGSALSEKAFEGKEISGEAIASQMKWGALLGGGVSITPTAIGSAARIVGKTKAGLKWAWKLGKSQADRVYRMHAPEIATQSMKQIGAEQPFTLVNEAIDQGIVGAYMRPEVMLDRAQTAMKKSGETIGEIASRADDMLQKPSNISGMWDKIIDKVAAPLSKAGPKEKEQAAREVLDQVTSLRNRLGSETTMRELSAARAELDDIIYGYATTQMQDPNRTMTMKALRQVRNIMNEQIGEVAREAGVPEKLLNAAKRQYQVASHSQRIAFSSIGRAIRNSGTDSLDKFMTLASAATAVAGHPVPAIAAKAAVSAIRFAAPRLLYGAQGVARRALTSVPPPVVTEDINVLSRVLGRVRKEEAGAVRMKPAVSTVSQTAPEEFVNTMKRLDDAAREPMSEQYRLALGEARDKMLEYYQRSIGTSGFDVNVLGDGMEAAQQVLSRASVPATAAGPASVLESTIMAQQPGFQSVRALRDDITQSLNTPGSVWGDIRAEQMAADLRALSDRLLDPERATKLQAIAESTGAVRKSIEQKGSRLMGTVPHITPKRSEKEEKRRKAYEEIKNRVPSIEGAMDEPVAGGK